MNVKYPGNDQLLSIIFSLGVVYFANHSKQKVIDIR